MLVVGKTSLHIDLKIDQVASRGIYEVREGLLTGNTLDYPQPAGRQYPQTRHIGFAAVRSG